MRLRLIRPLIVPLLLILLCSAGLGTGHGPAAALAARARDTASSPPSTAYAGVSGVGVFRDTGPTDSWTGLTALPSTSGALALATGDSAHWRDVCAGLDGGVYCSHDGGATWAAGLQGRAVRAVLVPSGGARPFFAGADRLYRSDDGGRTWTPSGIAQPVAALLQAGTSATYYAGGTGRAWVSRNGGLRWTPIRARGLPGDLTIADLAVATGQGGTTLYAATSSGLWQWTTGAASSSSWTQARGLPAGTVAGVAVDGGRLIALVAGDGLYGSTDGGATWVRTLAGPLTALAQDPQQGDNLVAGDGGGAVRWSTDGGQTWDALGGTVAGNDGNPIRALAVVQRMVLPVDPVPDPHLAGVAYTNGHTVRDPFLAFWQANRDVLGDPETEQFPDPRQGGATAQYFQNMELVQTGGGVAPAPLGLQQQPGGAGIGARAVYPPDAHFIAYWKEHGGQAVFGPAVSPALNQPTNDGTGLSYLVQYFRNARLEYRPKADGYVVAPGDLGDQALQAMGWL